MNYADYNSGSPFTRIHEPRYLHPERLYTKDKTVIFREYSFEDPANPYYPIRTIINTQRLADYRELAAKNKNLIIGGRLGDFAYYDMDMSIGAALKRFDDLCGLLK